MLAIVMRWEASLTGSFLPTLIIDGDIDEAIVPDGTPPKRGGKCHATCLKRQSSPRAQTEQMICTV